MSEAKQLTANQRMWRTFRHNKTSVFGMGLTLAIVLVALLAPLLAPSDPTVQDVSYRFTPPEGSHLLGTDFFGRDVFSRVLYGARISLLVGAASVLVGMVIGILLGMLAGFKGGKLETGIMRLTDVMMSFPDEVFGIMIMVAIGTGLTNLIVAIALLMVPRFIRLAHGPTLALREREYISAAKAIGVRDVRLIGRHILPNIFGEQLVMATLWIGTAIRLEANLSFLGLGVSPPTPTWGNMIRVGLDYLTSAWWVSVFPGIAILLTVFAFNLLGDGLRDVTDPKLST